MKREGPCWVRCAGGERAEKSCWHWQGVQDGLQWGWTDRARRIDDDKGTVDLITVWLFCPYSRLYLIFCMHPVPSCSSRTSCLGDSCMLRKCWIFPLHTSKNSLNTQQDKYQFGFKFAYFWSLPLGCWTIWINLDSTGYGYYRIFPDISTSSGKLIRKQGHISKTDLLNGYPQWTSIHFHTYPFISIHSTI